MSGDLTARDVIARTITEKILGPNLDPAPGADAVLAALAAAGWRLEREGEQDCSYCGDYLDDGCPVHGGEGEGLPDDQWEWNVREQWGALLLNESVSENEARGWLQSKFPRTLVRRRPAGEWEVAP